MKLYNTLSGQKEGLERPAGRPLKLFVCGPTVYDLSHIGHARTYIFFDALVRHLRASGWGVSYIQNITDVDDRIIARAKEGGENPLALAKRFAQAYFDDMKALGIASVTKYAPATRFIPEIVQQVELLQKKGFTYVIAGDGIYFDIAKFPAYGKLSHRTVQAAEDSVSRIDESVKKRNKGDFCLWKFPKSPVHPVRWRLRLSNGVKALLKQPLITPDGEPVWKTSLGWGRPGWHIEDTAISVKYFGPQYDLHGGAMDLKFPHHEAEIAQAEAAYGREPFVKIWLHTGFLIVNGEKMSKSLGNFITIRDFLKEHSADALRYIALSAHYRTPIDYSPELAAASETSLKSVKVFLAKLEFAEKRTKNRKPSPDIARLIAGTDRAFAEALEEDFNTPAALGTVFALVSGVQPFIWALSPDDLRAIAKAVASKFAAMGFGPWKNGVIPQNIAALAQKRELSRQSKQFAQSDALRKEANALGYSIEDTPLGPFVFKE